MLGITCAVFHMMFWFTSCREPYRSCSPPGPANRCFVQPCDLEKQEHTCMTKPKAAHSRKSAVQKFPPRQSMLAIVGLVPPTPLRLPEPDRRLRAVLLIFVLSCAACRSDQCGELAVPDNVACFVGGHDRARPIPYGSSKGRYRTDGPVESSTCFI